MSAPTSLTLAAATSGYSDPTLRLMFMPSGSVPILNTLARAPRKSGRNPVGRAVGAIEHDFQAVEVTSWGMVFFR
jgi:hypothetical protein